MKSDACHFHTMKRFAKATQFPTRTPLVFKVQFLDKPILNSESGLARSKKYGPAKKHREKHRAGRFPLEVCHATSIYIVRNTRDIGGRSTRDERFAVVVATPIHNDKDTC